MNPSRIATIAALAASLASSLPPAGAATRTWDGGGRGNGWGITGNWTGVGVPVAGDDLVFPPGANQPSNENDYAAGTDFNQLTWSGAGYTANGNQVNLTTGITVSHGAGNTALFLPIGLNANQTFAVTQAGANLFLGGVVNLGFRSLTFSGDGQVVVTGNIASTLGLGSIRLAGPGTLTILTPQSHSGATLVNGGTLRIDRGLGGSLANSRVTVNAGGILRGNGELGGLLANAGGRVAPGGSSPATLESFGDVTLAAGSTFTVRLDGPAAGSSYDQLDVTGTLTLGGTLEVNASFVPPVGTEFTIVKNDGSDDITGTFAGLPEGALLTLNGRPFRIRYGDRFGGFGRDTNDVTLEAVPALRIWDGGGGLNRFWTQPLNWEGDLAPLPGDDLQFASTGSSTLTNDFPPGHVFGSLLLAGGTVRLGGNAAQFDGTIRDTQPGEYELALPITLGGGISVTHDTTLSVSGLVSLLGNKTVLCSHPDAVFSLEADLSVGAHTLTVQNVPLVRMLGSMSGTGALIKNGTGTLAFENFESIGTNSLSQTTVNEGTLDVEAVFLGSVVVNPGGRLEGGFFHASRLNDVDIRGGTFEPSFGARVEGMLRFSDSATFAHSIVDQGANGIHATYVSRVFSQDPTELIDCNYSLTVTPGTFIPPGSVFRVISDPNPIVGTFNGLDEGERFLVSGNIFEITYQGISQFDRGIFLIANPSPFVWDGDGPGGDWTTAGNWNPDFAPVPGIPFVFPDGVSQRFANNDFPANTLLPSLTFQRHSYVITGNPFRLTEGIFNHYASGATTVIADFSFFGSNVLVEVANASELRLSGMVGGDLAKTGTGTLHLSGNDNNTLSGDFLDGRVELEKSGGATALSGSLTLGDGTAAPVLSLLADHQIADDANLTVRAPASFALNGNNEGIDNLFGDGNVALTDRLQFRSGLTVQRGTFSGTFSGNGTLTKSGPGVLTLQGSTGFPGRTVVAGGELRLQGGADHSPGEIRLNGGMLIGPGTVGPINGGLGGVLRVSSGGAGFEVMLRCHDVVLNPATTLRARLTGTNPGFENHKLSVTGPVTLGGAVLNFEILGNLTLAPGATFLLVENDGTDAIVGTFSGLPEGATFSALGMSWQITYVGGSGNDVAITLVEVLPPLITSLRITPGTDAEAGFYVVEIEGRGAAGRTHDLEMSHDLLNWLLHRTFPLPIAGNLSHRFLVPLEATPAFFRVRRR